MAIAKRKKGESTKLQEDIWIECKRIVRQRFESRCYTCGNIINSPYDYQTGHGKPKGDLAPKWKYDLRNLRPQCMRCNMHLNGRTDIFLARVLKEKPVEYKKFLQESCDLGEAGEWIPKSNDFKNTKETTEFYRNLLEEYKKL